MKTIVELAAAAALALAAPAAAELWENRTLRGSTARINADLEALETGGYSVRVEGCQFFRLSFPVVRVKVLRTPDGRPPAARTELVIAGAYEKRIRELEALGNEVDVRCYENLPGFFGDHGVIQYRQRKP